MWGQSAGAGSVSSYALAWYEDPIVKGIIADSGAAVPIAVNTHGKLFTHVAGMVGCGGLEPTPELECMRDVEASVLLNILASNSSLGFRPAVDNVTNFANSTDRIERGLISKVVSLIQICKA